MKGDKVIKSSRKLKDYPPIPSTPPPTERKDKGLLHLEEELEQEKKYLAALCYENKELEEILQNFDKEITYIKSNFPQQIAGDGKIHANNEFWFKYESQMELNRKLEKERKHLLNEIRQIEEQGLINLDSLTQSELILYVKQLERTKTDLLSDLRAKEWGLDKQAKDIHHLNDVKRTLLAEIRHYDKEFAMFRHYKKNSCPSASPTESRFSSVVDDGRFKLWKDKDKSKSFEKTDAAPDKQESLSQENIADAAKSEIMFSSLDETRLARIECESPALGSRRKSTKVQIADRKRASEGKVKQGKKSVAIAPLPDLPKARTPSPRILRTKRVKAESKVGSESPKPKPRNENGSKPIKIIVTYETQTTTVTEKKVEAEKTTDDKVKEYNEETQQSAEEVYEDDFEDSEPEKYPDKNSGFYTTRV